MHILHGSWLDSGPSAKRRGFVVWAETDQSPFMSTRVHSRLHPFSVRSNRLGAALSSLLPATAHWVTSRAMSASSNVWLPTVKGFPSPSSPVLQIAHASDSAPTRLESWSTDALYFDPKHVLALLTLLPGPEDETPGVMSGTNLRFWQSAARFALELVARQRFMPTLVEEDKQFFARWKPLFDEPNDHARLERLVRAMPPSCRALAPRETDKPNAPSARALLENFFGQVIDAFARANAAAEIPSYKFNTVPGTVAEAWLAALTSANALVKTFNVRDLRTFFEQVQQWTEPLPGMGAGDSFRLCFRLDPPLTDEVDGIRMTRPSAREWSLHYFLQATDDPSLLVPAEQVWAERGTTLRFLNRKFDAPQERMLAGLGHASRLFPPIEAGLRTARPSSSALTAEEAYSFIRETALLLRSFGFGVLVPGLSTQLGVRVRLKSPPRESPKGGVAGISFEDIVNYDWQVVLGDTLLSRAEFEQLAALKTPLVQVRGKWVELRPEQMQAALKMWGKNRRSGENETAKDGVFEMQDALRLALGMEPQVENSGLPVVEVVADGWIGDLLNTLREGAQVQTVAVPPSFRGTLRHYQIDGVSWLAFLRQWGLGGILADDMGLGKTPQTIALLLHQRAMQNGVARPTLVVCPTSVVSNWERELARFGPELRVYAHHGAARKKNDLAAQAAQHDVILSTYPLLQRDEKELSAVQWDNVILDEAQNIKNPSTKQAQAARKLNTQWHLGLTGTPVENRLGELWSLFQFINPGYLGSRDNFQKRFANPIERGGDEAVTKQLKQLTGPFILRRVKTDPTVIQDLPAKNEIKVFINLTREQATLYEAVVRDSLALIEQSEGIERRGLVLATLTRLKQVCNHPAQFLGDGSALAGRSGKLARLQEMLDEVRVGNERALVFTQYAQMGTLLQTYLQEMFEQEVLFLHGGVSAKKRPPMIERFQNDPHGPRVFILSIKAGGTGLNLTRANHVFHFDRWWNPAVENQATDRAFRIGQTKNVQVYKYICAGTFEEQIDGMIERKQALASSIVGSGEGWLTELSTNELRDLFKLRRDAVSG